MALKLADFTGRNGIRKTLDALVSKHSKKIIERYKNRYIEDLELAAKEWQAAVRAELSKPVQRIGGMYIRNTSLWPRMQQGRLVRDIQRPTVTYAQEKRDRINQIRFKISNFYGTYIETMGVYLNFMVEPETGEAKPFAGWLTRANNIWDNVMRERLRNG